MTTWYLVILIALCSLISGCGRYVPVECAEGKGYEIKFKGSSGVIRELCIVKSAVILEVEDD